jgi:hypothetical protein
LRSESAFTVDWNRRDRSSRDMSIRGSGTRIQMLAADSGDTDGTPAQERRSRHEVGAARVIDTFFRES